ncbi:DUF5959 family protein [Streptomyces anulatus]
MTSALPLKARLAYLYLGGTATTRTGLRRLSHWQDPASLYLDNLATALADEDWQEVTQLPVVPGDPLEVTVHDSQSTQIAVQIPVDVPNGWLEENRLRLEHVRKAIAKR